MGGGESFGEILWHTNQKKDWAISRRIANPKFGIPIITSVNNMDHLLQ
jgi:hypothetical protein